MKSKIFRRMSAIVMAFVMSLNIAAAGTAKAENEETTKTSDIKSSLGIQRNPIEFKFTKAAENSFLLMENDKKEGAIRITDKKTGAVWQSSVAEFPTDKLASGMIRNNMGSQLVLKYVDIYGNISSVSSRTESIKSGKTKYENIKNGFRATYNFKKPGVKVPVEYTIDKDCFRASVIVDEIKETGEKYRLYTLSLLPYFGSGSTEDEGYMLVPDGSGALIRYNNGKARLSDYSQEIYGRDSAIVTKAQGPVVKTARLPVFGVKKNSNAFLAVIDEGEARTTLNAGVSGVQSQYNTVYPEFTYRYFDSVAVKEKNWDSKSFKVFEKQAAKGENFTVKYYPLAADKSDYTGMALRYRQVLTEDKGIKSEVRKDEPPLYINFFGSLKKTRYFLGIPYTAVVPLTSYTQAADIMQKLKKSGVNEASVYYETWMSNSTDKNIPTHLKPCRALGGKKDLESLMKVINKNGYTLYGDININEMTENRRGYRCKWDSSKGVSQSPALQYSFLQSTYEKDPDAAPSFYLKPVKVKKAAEETAESLKKSKVYGLAPVTLGKMLYSDFGKNKTDRSASLGIWEKALQNIRKSGKGLLLADANAYGFRSSTDIIDIPTDSSHFHVEDETVPFYSLVLHGLRNMAVPAVNFSEDARDSFLKAMELGVSLQFSWTAGNEKELNETPYDYLYNGHYEDWFESAVKMQKDLQKSLKGLTGIAVTGHETLESGAVKTTYENGTVIYVNYSEKPAYADGLKLPAKDYLVKKQQ